MIEEVAGLARGGVRAYARHRRAKGMTGTTHRSVQAAIKRKRLDKSVSVVDGVPLIDFEQADQEWADNTQHLKAVRWNTSPEKQEEP